MFIVSSSVPTKTRFFPRMRVTRKRLTPFANCFESCGAKLRRDRDERSSARYEHRLSTIQARSFTSCKMLPDVTGHQWFISFMTRGELLLWPKLNRWGSRRQEELVKHIDLCATLLPDDNTCEAWADVMTASRRSGRTITAADAWVAAAARQWDLALVTADYRDFEHLEGLTLIPLS